MKREVSEADKIIQQLQSLKNLIAETKREADKKAQEIESLNESLKPLYMDKHNLEVELNELKQPSLFS